MKRLFMKRMKFLKESKAVTQKCSVKQVLLETSQNSRENTCARFSFFNKVAGLRSATLLKKRLWHGCFPVTFAKFIRTPFLKEHLRWLLLKSVTVLTACRNETSLLNRFAYITSVQKIVEKSS